MKKKEIPQENAGQNENEKYDIFISYRRDGGWETAKHLRDILVGKKYWVFFDMNDLKNGYFNNALLHYIDECQDFIIILSPNSLDRCKESEEDWVRKELAHALKAGKNIIPVMHEKFDFPKDLPDDIKDVAYINGIRVYKDVFDAIVERIISFLKSKPHLPPEPPKPKPWKKILGIILVVLALITGGFFAFRENLTNLLKPGSGNDPGSGNGTGGTETPAAAPGKVSNLKAEFKVVSDKNTIYVTWSAASNAASYDVYMKKGTGATATSYALRKNVTKCEYSISGVTNGKLYTFKVIAKNKNGDEGEPVEASCTVPAGSAVTVPGEVQNLKVALTENNENAK